MSFEKYIENKFYDEIFKKLKSYILNNKRNLNIQKNNFLEIKYISLNDFHINKYKVIDVKKELVTLDIVVINDLEVYGYTKGKNSIYETDNSTLYLEMQVIFRFHNGISDLKVLTIEEYDRNKFFNKKEKYNNRFTPYIKKNELDDVAENLLKEYYPEVLENNIPLSVIELVRRLNLNIVEEVLTKDKSILGKMVFKDSEVDVIIDGEESKIFVHEGTILVDPEIKIIRNEGSYNNTIVHECVHWIMHRINSEYNFILREKYGIKINREDREWIEWQTNSIAPRLLMPRVTTKKKIQELHLKYTAKFNEYNRTKMYELVIDELSKFYGVSKLAAKIRLIQLGYPEYEGVYKYVGNEYLRSYAFEVDAIQNKQTYTITFEDACYLNMFNEDFNKIMDSRKYVYVDSHFCINDVRYVRITKDGIYEMTDYAYLHMDECCLKFNIRLKDKKKELDFSIFNEYILNRGRSPITEVEIDFVEYLERPCVKDNTPNYTLEINEKIANIYSVLPPAFPESFKYHRNRKKITQEKLEEFSLVSVSTIKHLENEREYSTKLETIIALCIGMKLYPDFSFDLIDKANCIKLNRMLPQHNAYKMILLHKYHWSIHECNEFLEKGKLKKII